ncbi:Flp pilus assembly protein CpaB [Acidovorax sp. CCYZU-2555]|uniref:Flp pilus assembly protein CpaB n=1 Tax=Acidovorax sp. CCYZU-2555 TaxID=2835042 RepID=UPI001BCD0330|nr:Flp pilus assembly protein CpaB [Acidovorax sp. CCYZU-2555]MBS7780225.1 Flp pilus assembly protein CpaB [Acidovorax sp. CCYZU-2555]
MNLTKILAGLLLVLAIGLAIGAWMLSRPNERALAPVATDSTPREKVEQHAVVVAAKAIAAGQRLLAEDVKIVQLPAAVASSFSRIDAVLGRTTVMAMSAEAPLFEQHLIQGLALQLENGQRAVSIAVKEPMAAGHHVRPGDFVDVFFTLDGKTDQASVDTQTRLLLARSRVLAYGAASVENPPPSADPLKAQDPDSGAGVRRGTRDNQNARSDNANTAVLAVPLDDVQRLTLAEKYGQLTLALRHPDDSSVPDASLFAALPTVLQPVAGRLPKGESLQPVDRSYAGLRFKDLATGADAKNMRRPPATVQTAAAVRPAPTPPPRQQTVELHQGSAVQTVSY